MRGSNFARLRPTAVVSFFGLALWAGCSSQQNDFFGEPPAGGAAHSGASGSAGQASGGADATGGAGGTGQGGSASGNGGSNSSGGAGASSNQGGSTAPGGEPGAGAGGSDTTGGTHGASGNGGTQNGTGGSGGTDAGAAGGGAGEAGASGGASGTTGEGGLPNTGGAGMGGSSSGIGGSAGTAGTSAGTAGASAGSGGSAGTAGTGAGTSGTAGAGGSSSPPTCADDGGCASNEFCKKSACDAATGQCTMKPASCTGDDATFAPVCGCDHMTYYTPCVADREGVNVASQGECTSDGAPCTRTEGGASCSPARALARCYRPRTSCTGTSASEGVCWVLPDTCPTEDQVNRYCNMGGTPSCVGLCEGLYNEYPVWRDSNLCE
jgi:hypothetical protein